MNPKLERLYNMAVNDLTQNLLPWWAKKAVDLGIPAGRQMLLSIQE